MSSQHHILAAVWEHLLGHHDIRDIVNEIVSQHALSSLSALDGEQAAFHNLIWLKTVYDLQRCYLVGNANNKSHPSVEASNILLPPDVVYSTVLYLVDVKKRWLQKGNLIAKNEVAHRRCVLTLSVLSGLRLLLLHTSSISASQKLHLRDSIRVAWQEESLQGFEQCLVAQVFSGMLRLLRKDDHVDAYEEERNHAQLPSYWSGLYPLHIRPEVCITPLIHAMAEEDDDWIDAYCLLYDAIWAVECAATQRHVDLRRHFGSGQVDHSILENDDILEHLHHQRSSLIVSIFHFKGTMRPSNPLMESLAITLLDWDDDLDNFLMRQDSLVQSRMSLPQAFTPSLNYGHHIQKLKPYFQNAMEIFAEWLSSRYRGMPSGQAPARAIIRQQLPNMVDNWTQRMAHSQSETCSKRIDGPCTPVYVVNCSKLHAVPKKYLAYQLRWADRFAYESLQDDSPFVNWKEGVQCPSCAQGQKVKCARLLEPLNNSHIFMDTTSNDAYSQSQYSGESSGSVVATTASTASRSFSEGGSLSTGMPGHSATTASAPTSLSNPSIDVGRRKLSEVARPPTYDSPISPISPFTIPPRAYSAGTATQDYPISPLTESLNIPIPVPVSSRLSVDLPIPVERTTSSSTYSVQPDVFSDTKKFTFLDSKPPKSSSNAMFSGFSGRKSVKKKSPLPKESKFAFSASGTSLLLWVIGGESLTRFDRSDSYNVAIGGCIYKKRGIQAAAAGNSKCALVSHEDKKALSIYGWNNAQPELEVGIDAPGPSRDICIAMSKDDKNVAISTNGRIELFKVEEGLKRLSLKNQTDVYELRGAASDTQSIPLTGKTNENAPPTASRTDSNSWFGTHSRSLSLREAAEEQSQQTAIVSRKLYFSTDCQRLVVATQLGDHTVHVDVWDITREPVNTISEHSRSFKLPPWVLNDGDLTGVFYDSTRRAALVTAFLGKEYPMLIPFPGYDTLHNETYSTKIVSAAQSPSGSTFIIANAMTEIIQFEYTAKGTLSPRKLKKASSKISTSVFKPGAIALAMPAEDVLQVFWIRDGKCMLRTIRLGITDSIKDEDIRPQYDRLTSMKDKPLAGRVPSIHIPELDA